MAADTRQTQSVAVLGLGAMGSRIARRLAASGRRVVVWNRTPARAAELTEAEQAESPAAAAASVDVVITMVADPSALEEVAAAFAPALRPGQTLLEMSTVGPAAVGRLRASVPDGVAVVDAPVLGSIEAAEGGELTIFVGGNDDEVARVHPLLAVLGTPIHVGGPGIGAAAKLVANSTLFGVLTVLGEAIKLADALGLERETTFDLLAHTPLAEQAARRRDAISRSSYPPRFALRLARKDAMLTTDAAHAAGIGVPAAEAARRWLTVAEQLGAGASDYSAVLDTIVRANARDADAAVASIAAAAAGASPRQARAAEIADAIRTRGGLRWVGLYDVDDRDVTIVAWSGGGPPSYPRFPRDRGLTARAVATSAPVVVDDVAADADYLEAFGDTRAEAIVPVVVDGSVVGTIDVESSRPAAFADADVAFLERCRDAAAPLWLNDA